MTKGMMGGRGVNAMNLDRKESVRVAIDKVWIDMESIPSRSRVVNYGQAVALSERSDGMLNAESYWHEG